MAGNAVARALVGDRLSNDLRGQTFHAHLPIEIALDAARQFARCVTSGELVEGDTWFLHSDGTHIPVRVRLVPARFDGEIVGVIGIARPLAITGRR
jgi:hypothetical protein